MEAEKVNKVHMAVLDVQSTSNFLLKKLTQLTEQQCSSSCTTSHRETSTQLTQMLKSIQDVQAQENNLELTVSTMKSEMIKLQKENQYLFEQLKLISRATLGTHNTSREPPNIYQANNSTDSSDDKTVGDTQQKHRQGDNWQSTTASTRGAGTLVKASRNNFGRRKQSKEMLQGQNAVKTSPQHNGPHSGTEKDILFNHSNSSWQMKSSTDDQDIDSEPSGGALVVYDAQKAREAHSVEESQKEYHLSAEVWKVEAAEEMRMGSPAVRDKEGVFTVIMVDTSSSMLVDTAWYEAETFFHDYISGLETMATSHDCKDEYVSLVTFGNQTRCQQRFTNDFSRVKDAFGRIVLGGPSPLFGGLMMAHGVAVQPNDMKFLVKSNDIYLRTKVVIISDCRPTDVLLYRGPDVVDANTSDETAARIQHIAEQLSTNEGIELFFVPVGRANMEFLNLISDSCNGKILSFRYGPQLARRYMLTKRILPQADRLGLFNLAFMFGQGGESRLPRNDPSLTQQDIVQMREIIEVSDMEHQAIKQRTAIYEEFDDNRLPPIGTRVRRGPDWSSDDADGNGPGTIIGHHKDYLGTSVHVIWDAEDKVYKYDYGHVDKYEVFEVEEPRVLLPGQPLDVGCIVTPGKDYTGNRVKAHEKGVVLRIGQTEEGIRKALVRWDNGDRGAYSFGIDRKYEVRMCNASESAGWRPTRPPKENPETQHAETSSQKRLNLPPPPTKTGDTKALPPTKKFNKNKNSD